VPGALLDEQGAAVAELAIAQCRSDAELIEKLRYLLEFEREFIGDDFRMSDQGTLPVALDFHFRQQKAAA
jgi:hypothetical protein